MTKVKFRTMKKLSSFKTQLRNECPILLLSKLYTKKQLKLEMHDGYFQHKTEIRPCSS